LLKQTNEFTWWSFLESRKQSSQGFS